MTQGTTTPAIFDLERLRRRVRQRVLLRGLLGWIAVTLPAVIAVVWIAGAEAMRGGLIAAGLSLGLVAFLALAAARLVWRPWRRYADRALFAAAVDARGSFANVVVAAEEAARKPERWSAGDAVASELARRLDAAATTALSSLTPMRVDPDPARGRRLAVVALAALSGRGIRRAPARAGWSVALHC
jgi:malonyl CoA-acyl carrier protein transacylase